MLFNGILKVSLHVFFLFSLETLTAEILAQNGFIEITEQEFVPL